jgi:ribose transport system substrate-binding protein
MGCRLLALGEFPGILIKMTENGYTRSVLSRDRKGAARGVGRYSRSLAVAAQRIAYIGLALAMAVCPACTHRVAGPQRIVVGFVSNNADPFWTIAEAGTRKAATEFDVDVLFRRPLTGTAAAQKEIIEDLMTRHVQAIAISVNDPQNQRDFLDRIAGQVPLITQDNDAPDSKRLCYIGTNNYQAGRDAGKMVKEAMPEGGTIAIFVGKPDPLNARERRQGVLDELAGEKDAKGPKYGKYELLNTYYDYVDQRKAKDNAADALAKLGDKPNVCFVGLWAYNPPAILSATKNASKQGKVKIVAFDENENTLIGIKEGHIYGTIVQQPFEFGYQSVKLMTALAKGDRSGVPSDGIMYIPHLIIKRDNVEEFHQRLNQLLGK